MCKPYILKRAARAASYAEAGIKSPEHNPNKAEPKGSIHHSAIFRSERKK